MTVFFRRSERGAANRAAYGTVLLGLLCTLAFATSVQAQEPDLRLVEGRVVRPAPFLAGDSSAVVTVANEMVTLHRVSPTLKGPLDSMRTDSEGAYSFRYLPSGGPEAVYFVSATYDGIAYFTNPLRSTETRGAEAEIAVFDTTSRVFPQTVRGRHLIIGSLDTTGHRTVVEVFELSNDSTKTLVSREEENADPTWVLPVPRVAKEVKAGQGDLPADAFVQTTGQVALYAALAPGLKQISISYLIDEREFPLTLNITQNAVVLEVLLEEAEARVTGGKLVSVEPVDLEGRRFQRFLAQDVAAGDSIIISAPGSGLGGRGLYVTVLLGAIGLLMLLALLRSGIRKQRPIGAPVIKRPSAADVPTPERLAREIADLDRAFGAQDNPSEAVRTAYERRRAELAEALRQELAGSGSAV